MPTRGLMIVATALTTVLVACGGDDGGTTSESTVAPDRGADSGAVVNAQPPGQAHASVDGLEFTFDMPAPSDCVIESDRLTFGFLLTEDGADLAGGANRTDGVWAGDIAMRVYEGGAFVGRYYPDEGAMDTGVAIDGDSMSFSGPMLKQPPNDGTNPPPVSVGDGSFSVTCP